MAAIGHDFPKLRRSKSLLNDVWDPIPEVYGRLRE